jgi:hypothetical protein
MLPAIVIGTQYYTQPTPHLLRWGSQELFSPGLAWNLDLPNLSLPSGYDCRHEPQVSTDDTLLSFHSLAQNAPVYNFSIDANASFASNLISRFYLLCEVFLDALGKITSVSFISLSFAFSVVTHFIFS